MGGAAVTSLPERQARVQPFRDPAAPPAPLTSFVGRDTELARLAELLSGCRLLTLTGAGGSGKTRLALELLRRVADSLPQEVAWIELGGLRDGALVAHQIAAGLGLRDAGNRPVLEHLVDAVQSRPALLVLDTCEHLVADCATVAETLLRQCPDLRLLATSREALGVSGECAWPVPGLSLPAGNGDVDSQYRHSEAVRLFVERARDVRDSFELQPDNAAAVAQICRRLDGLPLAVELAAARLSVLSASQIADRLQDVFRLLTNGGRTSIPRHRTLEAVIDWSYELLDARERLLFNRLSVFAAGFSLEAAEVVCCDESIEPEGLLDLLSALVAKSLVQLRGRESPQRFEMLDAVDQYATRRLYQAGGADAFLRRHAEFYLALAEEAEPHIVGGIKDLAWIARLDTESANLRAAADLFATTPGYDEQAVRLAVALDWFWFARGALREARMALDAALTRCNAVPPMLRLRLLCAAGQHAYWRGDYAAMLPPMQAAGDILPEASPRLRALAETGLGTALALTGDVAAGLSLLESAVARARGIDAETLIWSLGHLAEMALHSGDHDRARMALDEGVAAGRSASFAPGLYYLSVARGRLAYSDGDHEAALAAFRQAMGVDGAWQDSWAVLQMLECAAGIVGAGDGKTIAVQLFAAAARAARLTGGASPPSLRERSAGLLEELRRDLDEEVFASAWQEGWRLSLQEALTCVLHLEDRRRDAPPDKPATSGVPASKTPALAVAALGPFRVSCCGEVLPTTAWSYGKPKELLMLLLNHREGMTRERIGAVLWPELSSAQVKNNFHVTLHHLRKVLGDRRWVVIEGQRYRLNPDIHCDYDAGEFESAARSLLRQKPDETPLERCRTTLALYRGHLLEGEALGDWYLEHQERLQRLYIDLLLRYGELLDASNATQEAVEVYRRIVTLDELYEAAHRRLMLAYARAGERHQAIAQFERLSRLLRDELDVDPDPETIDALRQIQHTGAA